MRSSRKRKLPENTGIVYAVVRAETKKKLELMAGPNSIGWIVEELIVREWKRREKHLDLDVAEKSLNSISTMS